MAEQLAADKARTLLTQKHRDEFQYIRTKIKAENPNLSASSVSSRAKIRLTHIHKTEYRRFYNLCVEAGYRRSVVSSRI